MNKQIASALKAGLSEDDLNRLVDLLDQAQTNLERKVPQTMDEGIQFAKQVELLNELSEAIEDAAIKA